MSNYKESKNSETEKINLEFQEKMNLNYKSKRTQFKELSLEASRLQREIEELSNKNRKLNMVAEQLNLLQAELITLNKNKDSHENDTKIKIKSIQDKLKQIYRKDQ